MGDRNILHLMPKLKNLPDGSNQDPYYWSLFVINLVRRGYRLPEVDISTMGLLSQNELRKQVRQFYNRDWPLYPYSPAGHLAKVLGLETNDR